MVHIWLMDNVWHVLLSVIYVPVQLHVSSALLLPPHLYSTMQLATLRAPIQPIPTEIPVFHATRHA